MYIYPQVKIGCSHTDVCGILYTPASGSVRHLIFYRYHDIQRSKVEGDTVQYRSAMRGRFCFFAVRGSESVVVQVEL